MYRGDFLALGIYVTYADGDPVDLTGWTAKFIGKLNLTDADVDAVLNLDGFIGIQTNPVEKGRTRVIIHNADTLALPTSITRINYMWQLTDTLSNVHTLEKGILRVLPDITIST